MNKKTLFIVVGIVVLIGGIVTTFLITQANNVPRGISSVQRGNIIQEVSASGKVESPTKIALHFKNSGKLIVVDAKVGRKVSAGQLLAKQDTTQLDAQVSEMQAGIDLQKAKLNQLLGGASDEDIKLTEIKLQNARRKLYSEDLVAVSDSEARRNIVPAITGSYDGIQEGHYEFYFRDSNDLYSRNQISFRGLENGIVKKDDLPQKFGTKGLFVAFPEDDYQTDDRWTVDIPNKNGINYVSNLNAYNSAQAELSLKKSSARSVDIAVYQAQINQAEASLRKIQAQREDYMIFAPSSGVVTEVNGEAGEIIGPDKMVVSLGAGDALQIKLNIVEDSIVNVRVGQEVRITIDSIETEKFLGNIVAIDPAETIIGGAVYYQTTVLFDKADERIKSGMTANVWIKTAVSENTLFVPVDAVQNKNGKKIVQVLEGKQIVNKEVTTGIKNNLGMIEITSGLFQGEQVILAVK